MIGCFLQGFLQKFCIGRGNVIFLHRAAENKSNWGALQLGFRVDGSHELFGGALQLGFKVDGSCDCTIALYTVYRAI